MIQQAEHSHKANLEDVPPSSDPYVVEALNTSTPVVNGYHSAEESDKLGSSSISSSEASQSDDQTSDMVAATQDIAEGIVSRPSL